MPAFIHTLSTKQFLKFNDVIFQISRNPLNEIPNKVIRICLSPEATQLMVLHFCFFIPAYYVYKCFNYSSNHFFPIFLNLGGRTVESSKNWLGRSILYGTSQELLRQLIVNFTKTGGTASIQVLPALKGKGLLMLAQVLGFPNSQVSIFVSL